MAIKYLASVCVTADVATDDLCDVQVYVCTTNGEMDEQVMDAATTTVPTIERDGHDREELLDAAEAILLVDGWERVGDWADESDNALYAEVRPRPGRGRMIGHDGPACVGDCATHGRLCELIPDHAGNHACPECSAYRRLDRAEMIAARVAAHHALHDSGFVTTPDED